MIILRDISSEELLARYQAGERVFHEAGIEDDGMSPLEGANLSGIDLSKTMIVASFRSAILKNARMNDANLKTCDFSGADLRGADFSGSALCATTFAGARMDGAKFGGSYYHGIDFEDGFVPDW